MIQIDRNNNGSEVDLKVGDLVELSLAENKTTGFQWSFTAKAESVCELVKDDFEPGTGPPGSGGIHRWQFTAVHPGSGDVQLEYRRPWDKNAVPANVFKVSVRVTS